MPTLFSHPWFPRSSKTLSAPDSYAASLPCVTALFHFYSAALLPLFTSLSTPRSVFHSTCSFLLWPLLGLPSLTSGVISSLVTADAVNWTTPMCFYRVLSAFICPRRLLIFFSRVSSPPSLLLGCNRESTHLRKEAFWEKAGFVARLEDAQSKTQPGAIPMTCLALVTDTIP